MAWTLAIESSGRVGSVAVCRDGHVLASKAFPHGLQHAARLIAVIDELASSLAMRPMDLARIDVSIGPGSFTGLRVGATCAKMLAFATGARLVAVPSAAVLAENAPPDASTVQVVLDAKRGQVYTARFTRQASQWRCATPPRLTTLAEALADCPRPAHLIGEGIEYHRAAIPPDAGLIVTEPALWRARAEAVALLGQRMAEAGQFTAAPALEPLYIRLPEAEERWNALSGASRPQGG